MNIAVLLAAFLFTAAPRTLPPDLCAGSPDNIAPGADVTYPSGDLEKGTVCVYGTLRIRGGTSLRVTNVWSMAGGAIDIDNQGAGTLPIEIIYRDVPIDTSIDPEQLGNGTIGSGRFIVRGQAVPVPFVRLAAEARSDDTVLQTEIPTAWALGTRIVLPDTRHLAEAQWFDPNLTLQHEVCTVVSTSGTSVTCA